MEKFSAKATLFENAMALFRSNGYDSVTIQQICKASNVTRNAFYYYFDSKEDLLGSYFENIPHFTESLLAGILALPNDWKKLWYLFEAHLGLIKNEGLSINRAFLRISMDGNGDLLTKYFLSETVCIPLIRNCQESGLITNATDPVQLNYLATRLLLGILLTWCCKNGTFDLIAVSKEAFRVLMSPICAAE